MLPLLSSELALVVALVLILIFTLVVFALIVVLVVLILIVVLVVLILALVILMILHHTILLRHPTRNGKDSMHRQASEYSLIAFGRPPCASCRDHRGRRAIADW